MFASATFDFYIMIYGFKILINMLIIYCVCNMHLNKRIDRKKSLNCTYLNVRRDLKYSDTGETFVFYIGLVHAL